MSNLLIATHRGEIVPFYGNSMAGQGKRKMKGKGIADNLGKALNFLKDTKLISNTMGLFPNEKAQAISNIAKQIGLGKKRKARKQKGAGIFSDFGSGIGNAFGGIGAGVGSAGFGLGRGLFGGKKKGKKMINM